MRPFEARLTQSNMLLERERDNKLMNVQAALAAVAHEVRQPLVVTSISQSIVERHGGHITASSDGKSGALFHFVLPVR